MAGRHHCRRDLHTPATSAPAAAITASTTVGSSGESTQPDCARSGRAVASASAQAKARSDFFIVMVFSNSVRRVEIPDALQEFQQLPDKKACASPSWFVDGMRAVRGQEVGDDRRDYRAGQTDKLGDATAPAVCNPNIARTIDGDADGVI